MLYVLDVALFYVLFINFLLWIKNLHVTVFLKKKHFTFKESMSLRRYCCGPFLSWVELIHSLLIQCIQKTIFLKTLFGIAWFTYRVYLDELLKWNVYPNSVI